MPFMRSADALRRVRKSCLALPDTEEKIAWGAPTFRVGGRLFVMFANNHHGDGRIAIWANTPRDAQESLVPADSEHFFVPPYVGPGGWLGIRLDTGLDWSVVSSLISDAYQHTIARARRGRAPAGRRSRR